MTETLDPPADAPESSIVRSLSRVRVRRRSEPQPVGSLACGLSVEPASSGLGETPSQDGTAASRDAGAGARDNDQANDEYKVGYKRPPRHSQFKPGRSGNPSGRRKKAPSLTEALLAQMEAKRTVRIAGQARRMTTAETLAAQMVQAALGGDRHARALLLKYGVPLPAKELERSGGSAQAGADARDPEASEETVSIDELDLLDDALKRLRQRRLEDGAA